MLSRAKGEIDSMVNTIKAPRKSPKMKLYQEFNSEQKKALMKMRLEEYDLWKKEHNLVKEGTLKGYMLAGFLGKQTGFPLLAKVIRKYEEVDGERKEIEEVEDYESVLERILKVLEPDRALDKRNSNNLNERIESQQAKKLYLNNYNYVAAKWGLLKVCKQQITSGSCKQTEFMENIGHYIKNARTSHKSLRWGKNGYYILGKEPEKKAMKFLNQKKNVTLKEKFEQQNELSVIAFLERELNATIGYYPRPTSLYLLFIVDGYLIASREKNYDEAAENYMNAHPKIKEAYLNQKKKKLMPAQFLVEKCHALKVQDLVGCSPDIDRRKVFDIDPKYIPSVQVFYKKHTIRNFVTLSWLIFFKMKGYQLENQIDSEDFNRLFGKKY